ncbi:ABC transporter ATP-binding protein [Aureimonas phyllosphaerae]|uniref:Multiple sugar transport system ATP-binding protein n=1 Tax=Aureimonas phyllosphaerae TaxID=1166078 RepID=A0A7W6C248_9HYPH|nr:ABC transporter ATP-binding protein [Aureimonas phyllosphaerae]MBB3937092.1 multiple sugar transport system ATP-binding protein [Aureimonas phyllosphaerae]MBB3960793.1 multiple sugar transport system ATP-binding protein [Aureimonas phyllosphaerae]SFF50140.1 carbohydrate ABC transporter ATP-binding protein, CUT1 family [Aureimonas phyllosphaerae]
MAKLSIQSARKSYGEIPVLQDVSIDVEEGAFVVLLGPSGCGKSTLLHAIAGLHPIDSGRILIGDNDVTRLAARDRDVAMVFQSYALYPTMTVADNIGFPLKMRGTNKVEARRQVDEVARLLQIEPLLARYPRELSGGQRQRVAIGRALVRDPKLFLFDEPLSNLDAALRTDLRAEIKRLHQTIRRTMVYVTHDQIEAMTLATKIVIMSKGVVQQAGTPAEIYHEPVNLFVARFIGSPAMTLLKGRIEPLTSGCGFRIANGDGNALSDAIQLPNSDALRALQGRELLAGARPENVDISASSAAGPTAVVDLVEPTGPEDIVTLKIGGQTSIVRRPAGAVSQGQTVRVHLPADKLMLFDPTSGQRLL